MTTREPTLAALGNPLTRYVLATRPAFLSVTLIACLLGFAASYHDLQRMQTAYAVVTVFLALVAHAGVNVLNDYYDARNGTDFHNTERLYPYTGGSRFIQNGVLSEAETSRFGFALLAAVTVGGVWLAGVSAHGLLLIGAAGVFIGWAYSAPPFRLNSRGLGELCVLAGFTLIVIGADYVQRQAFALLSGVVGLSYGLLVTNLLYINQFPDREADALVGKRHWVVRLGPTRARWGYVAMAVAAYGWLGLAVWRGSLPLVALLALLPAPLSFHAAAVLLRQATTPEQLTPAIRATIAAALTHGILLAACLAVSSGPFRGRP